jgi:hypothetical protein
MKQSLAVLAFTSTWLSACGEESAYPHERDAKAAVAKTGGSPDPNAMHSHDFQGGSPQGLRKSRKDRRLQSFGDWEFCSSSSQCSNHCCSNEYSDDGAYKCTPLTGGFDADKCLPFDDILVETGDNDCWGTDTFCVYCDQCCNGYYWSWLGTYCN